MASTNELVRLLLQVRGLPPHAALFHARALLLARRLGDDFTWQSATRPRDVATILALARGRCSVAELGTATGLTAGALVLAERHRRVVSFDPVVQPHRERYLGLLPAAVRARLELHTTTGVEGAALVAEPVDFLFVDSTHEREATVAEVEAWRPRLAPGALVVLHDYENPAYPGVAQAVAELGLAGEVRGGCWVWRAPAFSHTGR